MRVHHIAVQVHDLARARAFYVDLLGLPELRRQAHSIWVDAEGTVVMLERGGPSEEGRAARAGLKALAFSMEPGARELWRERLIAHGHPVEDETDYTLYTRDPDGTRVALSSYPDKSR